MSKKTRKYVAGEIGRVRVVEDFLPSAETLANTKRKRGKKLTRHTDTEPREMRRCGESKTDWKAAAKKPLPSGAIPTMRWKKSIGPPPRCRSRGVKNRDGETGHGTRQKRTTDCTARVGEALAVHMSSAAPFCPLLEVIPPPHAPSTPRRSHPESPGRR